MQNRFARALALVEFLWLLITTSYLPRMPTAAQLESLYRVGYQLTYLMLQPTHFICVDVRTRNVYILVGYDEELEVPNFAQRGFC